MRRCHEFDIFDGFPADSLFHGWLSRNRTERQLVFVLYEEIDGFRIELAAAICQQLALGLLDRHCLPVRTAGSHRVKSVGDSKQPRSQRYLFSRDAFRISAACETFMMMPDYSKDFVIPDDRFQDLFTDSRMFPDQIEFLIRELAFLMQDRLRNPDFADVMHKAGKPDAVELFFREAQLARERDGDLGDTL